MRKILPGLVAAMLSLPLCGQMRETIKIDAEMKTTPLPHFWEEMFGSGRAGLSLRESYRNDLTAVKAVTDMKYIRSHGILQDELGVYDEDEQGRAKYNFTYVDQIYDGMLQHGVKPVVEIGFMPKKLASNPDALHVFWWKPNVGPPKSYAKWDALIEALGKHLVERYGLDEVAQWYFEVWNEPNIDFWVGEPKQKTYFELYAHTAKALKAADARLRVGGPATSAGGWIPDFLKTMHDGNVPVDFVSAHGYADENYENLLTKAELPPMADRVCAAMTKVHAQVLASPLPKVPLFWTEWNVVGLNGARDTTYVGPALANTIRGCDGLAQMMSFWTFSDVFEEDGVKPSPFNGYFGLIAPGGIKKPSFDAFAMLHHLGTERLANTSKDVLVTKRSDGTLVVAVWNEAWPAQEGTSKQMEIVFAHVPAGAAVSMMRLDAMHGNTLAAYEAMGSPKYPTMKQVAELNKASELGAPVLTRLNGGKISVDLPVNALVMMEIAAK